MPKISGFQFKRPQQLAALLLLLLIAQCLWVFHRQTLTSRDYDFARCGREMWEKPNPLAGYFTTCGNIHDGTLGYRVAGCRFPSSAYSRSGRRHLHLEMRHELSFTLLLLHSGFCSREFSWGCAVVGYAAPVRQHRRIYRARSCTVFAHRSSTLVLTQQ